MSIYMWREEAPIFTWLCFTAEEANSTVQLNKNWNPTFVNLEISTDWTTWIDYTMGDTITLANVWDKVYMRNKSETDTWFSMDMGNFYRFSMTWKIGASGDTTSLLNKNWTNILTDACFLLLFNWNSSLITAPELPATKLGLNCYRAMFQDCVNLTTAPSLPAMTLYNYCYSDMFSNCISLTTPPKLPATTLAVQCYRFMFLGCSNIKLSTTQTGEYQIPYRIPTTWIWTTATSALQSMFTATWWTFTWTPTINTTYYLSNQTVTPATWPCPEWYHVPTTNERWSVYDIWTSLGGVGGQDLLYFLKMPQAWVRLSSNGDRNNVGSVWAYWSRSVNGTESGDCMYFSSSLFSPQHSLFRSYWLNIRWFKNIPVIPTLSWNKLYGQSIEQGWIFWESSLWLISLSSDGQQWITISDKNVGATTVWSWSLSQANCGNYYQRGNNYGFPFTWTITTSATKVDASAYWPQNYYNNSIFIYNSTGGWDTSNNTNLRW